MSDAVMRATSVRTRRALRLATSAAASVALVAATGCGADSARAQDWDTVTSSRSIGDEQDLRVNVEYGAGTLNLGSAPEGSLYRADLRYDRASFTPRMDFEDGRLRVGVTGSEVRGRSIRGSELDLLVTRTLPVDLTLQFGAAEANLDLGGIRVRNLELQTGASRTTLTVSEPNPDVCRSATIEVGAARFQASGLGNLNAEQLAVRGGVGEVILDFTGEWRNDMTAGVEMGLGTLTVRVPRGLGVQVNRGGALTSFDGQDLLRRGNSYYSENFDDATHRLTVNLEAALGRIRVVWVD
ncbi:MAG TPA: hypothetical protein VK929_08910 [Longimicrobiales bacterium]|nr:hypothetical protein [Longimicrobiales bacterium]